MADFDTMSVEDLGLWLQGEGIPLNFCHNFEENFIDGKEFINLTENEVRSMVPPIGLTKKIMRLIPKPQGTVLPSTTQSQPLESHSEGSSPQTSHSTIILSESEDVSLSSASALTKQFSIPDSWPPAIMRCITQESYEEKKRSLVPSVRNEIVRVIANSMFCHDPNPRKEFCTRAAKLLVKKYKFMVDVGENVSGYGSWEKKLMEKVHNIKARNKRPVEDEDTPRPKRGRPKVSLILTRYPPVRDTEDDGLATCRNHETLVKEIHKERPRKEVVLMLARQTFTVRRSSVLSDDKEVCVGSLLRDFEELRRPYVVEQEIDLILEKRGVLASALNDWSTKWVPAILEYSSTLSGKMATVVTETRKAHEDDTTGNDKIALDLLCKIFSKKNVLNALKYIYEDYEMTDDPEEVGSRHPSLTAPRICCFNGDEPQYFLYVENRALFSVSNIAKAIMYWFILHYIFNLEYCTHVKLAALFFQEFVFNLPATSYLKHQKSATYLTVTTDIQKFT